MMQFKSEKDEALFQAMGPIGGVNEHYYTSVSPHEFCKRLWNDNTQNNPMPQNERDSFSKLLITTSICNACCYGTAKSGAYQSDICSNALAASSYDHYLNIIGIKLNGISGYLNDMASKVDGLVNGTVAESDFFSNCISLLRYLNFLATTADQADIELRGFQNTLKIQLLRDQLTPVIDSVRQCVSTADGIRAAVAERRLDPSSVQNLKMYMVSVIQAIPRYVAVYEQLRNRLKDCYRNNFEEESFNTFMQHIRRIAVRFSEVAFIGVEASTYSPCQCSILVQSLDQFANHLKRMILNSCMLMKYRCHFVKTVDELRKIPEVLESSLKTIITNFMAILSTAAQAFQNFANGVLQSALQELLTLTAEMNAKVDALVKAVKADKRYILYTPFTPKCITHPVAVTAITGISKIMGLAHTFLEEEVDFDNVKSVVQEFTPIYEKLVESLDSNCKTLKSVRKQKAVIQRKQVLSTAVAEFVNIMSFAHNNSTIPLLYTKCGVVCIELCLALCVTETHPKLLRIVDECLSMLSNIAVHFVLERSSLLLSVIVAVRDLVLVPENYKPVMKMVLLDLQAGITSACDVMKRNSDAANPEGIRRCLLECRKLTILVKSFQCILGECYIPANLQFIPFLIDNFNDILKRTIAATEKAVQLRAFHSLSIFFLLCDRYMMFLEAVAEHYVGERNLKATCKSQMENNAKCRKQLSLHRIEYRNSSKEMMSILNQKVPEYDQFLKNIRNLVKSEYYAEQLENYYSVMTQALESVKISQQITNLASYSYDDMPRNTAFLAVASIIGHTHDSGKAIINMKRNDVATIFSYAMMVSDLASHVLLLRDMDSISKSIQHCSEVLVEASTSMVLGDCSWGDKIFSIITAFFYQIGKLTPYIRAMIDQCMRMQHIQTDVYIVYEEPQVEDVKEHQAELKRLGNERSEMQKSLQRHLERDDKDEAVRHQQEIVKIMKQEEQEKKKIQAAIRHNSEIQELELVRNEIAAQKLQSSASVVPEPAPQRDIEEESRECESEEKLVEENKEQAPKAEFPRFSELQQAPINPIFQEVGQTMAFNSIFQDVSGPSTFKRPSKDTCINSIFQNVSGPSTFKRPSKDTCINSISGSPTTNTNPIFGDLSMTSSSQSPFLGGFLGNISLSLPEYSEADATQSSEDEIDRILRQELNDDDDEQDALAMFGYGRVDDDEYYEDDFYDDDLDDFEEEEELPFPFAAPQK